MHNYDDKQYIYRTRKLPEEGKILEDVEHFRDVDNLHPDLHISSLVTTMKALGFFKICRSLTVSMNDKSCSTSEGLPLCFQFCSRLS